MADLAARVLAVIQQREREATRLALLLHDEVGQILTGAGLELEALRRTSAEPQISTGIAAVQGLLEGALSQIRDLSRSLAPSALDRLGLGYALEEMVNRHRQLGGATIRLLIDGRPQPNPAAGAAFFRIATEALENAIRHSGATLIELILRRTSRGVELQIRDNGHGFNFEAEQQNPTGIGLRLMALSAAQSHLPFELSSDGRSYTIVNVLEKPVTSCPSVS